MDERELDDHHQHEIDDQHQQECVDDLARNEATILQDPSFQDGEELLHVEYLLGH